MQYAEFGQKVNRLRKARGLTAEKLAESCLVTTATIRHIEAGRRSVSLEVLLRLCNALEISPDYLLSEHLPFERHPDKHDIFKRLDALSPSQLELLSEIMNSILAHTDGS